MPISPLKALVTPLLSRPTSLPKYVAIVGTLGFIPAYELTNCPLRYILGKDEPSNVIATCFHPNPSDTPALPSIAREEGY